LAALTGNPTQIENTRPGTSTWELTSPATNGEIEGYASLTSVDRGGQINLFVNTDEPFYTIELYRIGWYGGLGGRQLIGPVRRPGAKQPFPQTDPDTGLVECDWTDPYVVTTNNPADPWDWPSGVYLAKLTAETSGKQSYIIFVVRDDIRPSDYFVQLSVTTYQAYNNWGGKSLYSSNSIGGQARKVSFNRPYAISANAQAAYGVGAGQFLTINVNPGSSVSAAAWEVNMVRWLEREGYDLTYHTNIDTHTNGNLLLAYKAVLSVGHDEYWSWEMRSNRERALRSGVSLGFFSANNCFWQIRLEPSAMTHAPDRTMVAYKQNALTEDPYALDGDITTNHLVTTLWRDPPVNLPEDALVGVMYDCDPIDGDIVISDDSLWVTAGTTLRRGDRLTGLLGYEVDRMFGHSPAGTAKIAHSRYRSKGSTGYSDMTVYSTANATVFATGSMQWAWGLDDYNAPTLRPSCLSMAAQQITRNVLARFVGDLASVSMTYSVVANPSAAALSLPFNVRWSAPNGHSETDWIGLFAVSASNRDCIGWQYTGRATAGNMTFTAPGVAGVYEFRYFANNTYQKVATSNAVTVTTSSFVSQSEAGSTSSAAVGTDSVCFDRNQGSW
jgi:hypothetical protein